MSKEKKAWGRPTDNLCPQTHLNYSEFDDTCMYDDSCYDDEYFDFMPLDEDEKESCKKSNLSDLWKTDPDLSNYFDCKPRR